MAEGKLKRRSKDAEEKCRARKRTGHVQRKMKRNMGRESEKGSLRDSEEK